MQSDCQLQRQVLSRGGRGGGGGGEGGDSHADMTGMLVKNNP